ncbi:hypothetical protein DOY81_007087, partial [Sarcophaga bullata]
LVGHWPTAITNGKLISTFCFHWVAEKLLVQQIPIDKEETDEKNFIQLRNKTYFSMTNEKMFRLPIIAKYFLTHAMCDVFLCIVPTAGRRNPKQNSDHLCKFVDRYREKVNPKANKQLFGSTR